MKQYVIANSLCVVLCMVLSGCASSQHAGSAKCMEQADFAYETDVQINDQADRECKATQVNKPNKELNNHGLVDRTLLEVLVSTLRSIFN